MPTNKHSGGDLYATWNPHFTPQWLSERIAKEVPSDFAGTLVDPACGSGNLLAAAALRLEAADTIVRFVGIDRSKRAVKACRATMSLVLQPRSFDIRLGDFLEEELRFATPQPTGVIMNPPFRGYGEMKPEERRRIRKVVPLRGRFNLAYAFVHHAITTLRPAFLISVLPSNWIHSTKSWFREELNLLGGRWRWDNVKGNAFPTLSVHVGVLIWQGGSDPIPRRQPKVKRVPNELDVRQGVATGCDRAFFEIGRAHRSERSCMPASRGRDVERNSKLTIWVPPKTPRGDAVKAVERTLSTTTRGNLVSRSCVRTGKRSLLQYHESFPEWFCAGPKLLLPEICTRAVRVELDEVGKILPLHSVIAVRVSTVEQGRALRGFLKEESTQERMLRAAPRLAGGARRLQVATLRKIVAQWESTRLKPENTPLRNAVPVRRTVVSDAGLGAVPTRG